MDALSILVGIALIGSILWEVFRDLFHPAQRGALSDWIGRHLFNILRRRRAALPTAGPLSLVLVIAVWVCGLGLGFALHDQLVLATLAKELRERRIQAAE
jgi:hypothetical protein